MLKMQGLKILVKGVRLLTLTLTRLTKGVKLLLIGDFFTLKSKIRYVIKGKVKKNNQARVTEEITPFMLMPGQPLVSVVIPCFNYGEFVIDAIESIQSQTLKNIEVIVVDGGSTDCTTIEILKKIQLQRTSIHFREGRHLVGSNRNYGIAIAKGRYICCLDADDTLDPTYLEKSIFYLDTYAYDIVSTSINLVGAKEGHIDTLEYPDLNDMVNGNHVLTCAVFRKHDWELSGGYFDVGVNEQHVAEDWDLWLRLAARGARIRNISKEYLFNYRVHTGGSLSSASGVKSIAEQKKMILDRNRNLLTPKAFENSKFQRSRFLRCDPQKSALVSSFNEQINSKKKILLLAIPFSIVGGAERLLSGLCHYLTSNEWRIVVITTLEHDASLGSSIDWFKSITPEVYELSNLGDLNERVDFIKYLIASRKPDCILNAGSKLIYEMLSELKKFNEKIRVVDLLFNKIGHSSSHIKFKEFIDSAFAENQEVYNWLLHEVGWQANKIKKMSSGVDLVDLQPKPRPKSLVDRYKVKDSDLVVGFSGRLSEEKGPEIFVKIAKLLEGTSNLRFVMTGAGPMSTDLQKQIESLSPNIKFEFAGLVEDIKPYLALYDILIVPSKVDGRPLVIMEALACGVPVIASNVGGLPELIEEGRNGYLAPAGNAMVFASKIQELAANRSMLKLLQDGARGYAEDRLDAIKAYREYDLALRDLTIEINA